MRSQGKKLARAAQLLARGQLRIEDREQAVATPEVEVTAALAAFGLESAEPLQVDEEFALWPDCLDTFKLWISVQTQWQIGDRGATGLDYSGVEACMRLRGIRAKDRSELFAGLQVMERAALHEWAT